MKYYKGGFTLIEFAVVVGMVFILFALVVPTYRFFEREADLTNGTEEIITNLRLAQSKTLASEGSARWGVYFSTSTNQYILFRGASYASRTASFDEVREPPKNIEIYDVSLNGNYEVVFDRILGSASPTGSVSLRLKTDPSKTKTMYVENSGQVGLNAPAAPADAERQKDSRHVQFDYGRFPIATSSEVITLTFGSDDLFTSTTSQDIVISENLIDNQIYWEGEVNAFGSTQKLKIHTLHLNNPDTRFSVHRDRRYNNKALTIEINGSPDPDLGALISYSSTGTTTIGTSIYVSNLQIQ